MTSNSREAKPSSRCGWWTRARVAARLFAGLRGHDFRAAATFVEMNFAHSNRVVAWARFVAWTLRQAFVVIPERTRQVRFSPSITSTPFWLAAGNPYANHPWNRDPEARLPSEVDTVVVGAGFTGASLAYFWGKQSPANRVMVVLEMQDPASGASGRNAGTVVMGRYWAMIHQTVLGHLHSIRADLDADARSRLAGRFADVYCRAAYKNADMIEQTVRDEGFDCEYSRRGWVQFRRPEEQASLDRSVAAAAASGFDDWTRATPAEIREVCGLEASEDAGFSKRAASFHPAKWVWSLFKVALGSGKVQLFTQTKVLRIEDLGDAYAVHTNRGSIRAGHVVNATEGHTPALHPQFHDVLWPMQTQAAAGVGGPSQLRDHIPVSGSRSFADRRGDHMLTGTDQTRIADRRAGQNKPSRFLTHFALSDLTEYSGEFPFAVTHEWSGSVGFTADEYPIVGLIDQRSHYVIAGMCGSGTAVSFNAGRCIVNRILGGDENDDYPPEFFAPSRILRPKTHRWPKG